MTRRLFALGLAAALSVGLFGGAAGASQPTPASGTTWAPNQRVEYRWRAGDEPPAWMKTAINAAATDNNQSRASRAAIFAQASDGAAWIAYTADLPTSWAIGYTVRYVPDYFTIRLRPNGYPLDWGTLRWCEFYDSPPTGCYDAEMITLHEFGHAQTLGHVDDLALDDWTDSIMHESPKTRAKPGWNAHEYGRCDVARLQIRYQPLTSSTPISSCLDLPTQLSLSASATSAPAYSSVTLTARLAIADDAIYPNLASDPLSDRRIVLQRRTPGSTTWSTIVEMDADGTGRYARSITVTATYEWRALYNPASGEGLTASASAPLRISLGYDCVPTAIKNGRLPMQPVC